MTDTVRIMPRQPIEAERINRPPAFRSLGREVLHHDGRETFLSARYWHEVSDPIVWDGTDESLNRILAALNGRAGWGGTNPLGDLRLVNPGTVGLIPLQGRIQTVGDSFVILPPEVTA